MSIKILAGKIGKASPAWKGMRAGYHALHQWLSKTYGKPRKCQVCKSTKHTRYEWAGLSKRYSRKKSNYIRLCKTCHIRFDYGLIKILYNNKIYYRSYRWRGIGGVRFDKAKNNWVVNFQDRYIARFKIKKDAITVRKLIAKNFEQETKKACI